MKKIKNNKKNSTKSKIIIISILFLVLAAGAVVALELTNTTYLFHEKSLIVSTGDEGVTNQETKGETASNDNETANDSSEKDPSPGGNGEAPELIAPQGNFVSNHYPNLSGSPAPNKMQSSCTTTPGATCQIVFTNTSDGTVRSLPVQTTDQGGTAIWDWSLKDISITEGVWKVKAVTALEGQTKTADDALNLEVKP